MRIFIAFPTSDEVKAELIKFQSELIRLNSDSRIKWIEPKNFHITAEFLGELNEADVEEVKKILKGAVLQHKPFQYQLERLDAFPNLNQPNVLMARALENGREGFALREKIHHELKELNMIENNKPWQPHITLGRVKDARHRPLVMPEKKINPIVWTVKEVWLVKSELSPRGSKYIVLEKFLLS